mmetsp:Transcript_24550/g.48160  ORF Transcript_24550/g.48160 Transcript_24550/m.48160 type:complete len:166 (-) Transcript_24550:789-1286(-)
MGKLLLPSLTCLSPIHACHRITQRDVDHLFLPLQGESNKEPTAQTAKHKQIISRKVRKRTERTIFRSLTTPPALSSSVWTRSVRALEQTSQQIDCFSAVMHYLFHKTTLCGKQEERYRLEPTTYTQPKTHACKDSHVQKESTPACCTNAGARRKKVSESSATRDD